VIEELYVAPEARRTGVARALLVHALDQARHRRSAHSSWRWGATQAPRWRSIAALGSKTCRGSGCP